jgi:hypothetical protein
MAEGIDNLFDRFVGGQSYSGGIDSLLDRLQTWVGWGAFGIYTGNGRLSMRRLRRSFCGTTTNGDIFCWAGWSFWRSNQSIIRENPASTWYCMSSWTVVMFSASSALLCGPLATACSITLHSQLGPQSTGTLVVPHLWRVGGKWVAQRSRLRLHETAAVRLTLCLAGRVVEPFLG